MPSEGIQGDEWATYVPLDTYNRDERGIAYGTRVLWRRRSRSSRRSHARPRRTGKPSTVPRSPGVPATQNTEIHAIHHAPNMKAALLDSNSGSISYVETSLPSQTFSVSLDAR